MADNIPITAGTGTNIATDDVSSVHYQVVKIGLGLNGVFREYLDYGQNIMASGIPVSIASNQSAIPTSQSGTWIVQPGNTANTTAWKVDASSVAVPITDNAGSLTVDNVGTFAVQATLAAGAAAIAKAEDIASANADVGVPAMAVRKATPANTSDTDADYEFLQMSAGRLWTSATIDAALPAGTNAIGKLAANSGITIGTVEIAPSQSLSVVTSVAALTGGSVAHDGGAASSNPLLMGAYASAAVPTDVSTDTDSTRLWCLKSGALAIQPTYAGILAVAGNGAVGTGVQRVTIANDSTGILATVSTVTTVSILTGGGIAHDGGASAVNPHLMGGYASAAAPTDVSNDTDSVRAWHLRNGAAACVVTAAGALIGGDATNGLDVDVTRVKPDGTNTMPSLDAAARRGYVTITDGTNSLPTMDVVSRASFNKITDGTLTAGLVDETGASAVDAQAVGGGTPHDSVNSGNPLLLGAEAIAHGANPAAVAAADRTKLYANRHGIPFVLGGHPNIISFESATTGAQTDVALATVGAGSKIVVTQAQVITDNANTAFPQVRIGFGTANTPTASGVVLTHPGLPAGGGVSRGDGSGILGVGADNEDLRITCGAPTGGSLRALISYFVIES